MPWQEVNWETMCDPNTLVTNEDPHISIPSNLVPPDIYKKILNLITPTPRKSWWKNLFRKN